MGTIKKKAVTFDDLGPSMKDPRLKGTIEIIEILESGALALKINDSDLFVMETREASKGFIQKMIANHQKVFENV